jgi:hypothetical protein
MKTKLEFLTRSDAVAQGFNFAGQTSDETMREEITRDYLAQGYSQVAWTRGTNGNWNYWTKHPAINP